MQSDISPASGSGNINRALPYILYGAFVSACFIYGALIASGMLQRSGESIAIDPPVPLPVLIVGLSIFNVVLGVVLGRFVNPGDRPDPPELFRSIVTRLILQSACFEAIAIYGLVGHLFGMAPIPSIFIVGFGLLCLLTLIPGLQKQVDRLQILMRQSEKAES